MIRGEFDCEYCPLDPCKLKGDECGLWLDIWESFKTLSDMRVSEEYLRTSGEKAK